MGNCFVHPRPSSPAFMGAICGSCRGCTGQVEGAHPPHLPRCCSSCPGCPITKPCRSPACLAAAKHPFGCCHPAQSWPDTHTGCLAPDFTFKLGSTDSRPRSGGPSAGWPGTRCGHRPLTPSGRLPGPSTALGPFHPCIFLPGLNSCGHLPAPSHQRPLSSCRGGGSSVVCAALVHLSLHLWPRSAAHGLWAYCIWGPETCSLGEGASRGSVVMPPRSGQCGASGGFTDAQETL